MTAGVPRKRRSKRVIAAEKAKNAKSLAMGIERANADTFAQEHVGRFGEKLGNFKTVGSRVSGDVSTVAQQLQRQMQGFFTAIQSTPEQMGVLFKNVVGETFSKVQVRTPVKTGHARSGWRLEKITDTPTEKHYRIVNTVPYVVFLEYGSSKQAPAGMVRVSLLESQRAIQEATEAYFRG